MVLPARGLNGQIMGSCQVVQPVSDKVGIGPALMIASSSLPLASGTFAKQTSQTHAYPTIQSRKRAAVTAVLKVREPATQDRVETRDLSIKLNQQPPCTPCSRAVNIRAVHTARSVQLQRSRTSPSCLADVGTADGGSSYCMIPNVSIFLRPLTRRALPRFLATMDALTPARRFFAS